MKNKEKITKKARELSDLLIESGNPYIILVDGDSEMFADGVFTSKELGNMLYNSLNKDTSSGLSIVLGGLSILDNNGVDTEIMREPVKALFEQLKLKNESESN